MLSKSFCLLGDGIVCTLSFQNLVSTPSMPNDIILSLYCCWSVSDNPQTFFFQLQYINLPYNMSATMICHLMDVERNAGTIKFLNAGSASLLQRCLQVGPLGGEGRFKIFYITAGHVQNSTKKSWFPGKIYALIVLAFALSNSQRFIFLFTMHTFRAHHVYKTMF